MFNKKMKPATKGAILISVWMFIFGTFILPYVMQAIGSEDIYFDNFWARVAINIFVWTIFGIYIAYTNNKKKAKKQING